MSLSNIDIVVHIPMRSEALTSDNTCQRDGSQASGFQAQGRTAGLTAEDPLFPGRIPIAPRQHSPLKVAHTGSSVWQKCGPRADIPL
jgi:hypothetical protein